jgi:predicted amidohydrolase
MRRLQSHAAAFAVAFLFVTNALASPGESDDWNRGNLIDHADFTRAEPGQLPQGWELVAPNPALAPRFSLVQDAGGKTSLQAVGNGRLECFGYLRHKVRLEAGKTYRMRARLRFEGMEDLNHHVVHSVFSTAFNDGIFTYRKEGDWVIGEDRFPGPKKAEDAEIRLQFRFSQRGKVWWDRVSLQECGPIPPRLVKVAVGSGKHDMAHWSLWLDRAGEKKADIALLTEGFNGKRPSEAEPIDGPSARMMAEKAKQWKMYVSGTNYEKRGDLVFNTAMLFDRQGKLVGTYEKVQLFDPEEHMGVTPGVRLPVFKTDFGTVGIMTCYDSWFPETARLLAYKGAELILLPNAGYDMELMPARAADNGVCIAVSSENCPAGIWDSGGARAGEKAPDETRYASTAIKSVQKDDAYKLLVATVDLSRRWSPHYWGGPMLSAPGGRRLRQTRIIPLEDEIAREAKRWWTIPAHPEKPR